MYAQPTLIGTPGAPASYGNISTFGVTSSQIIPVSSVLSNGYLAGQGFPAENENYLMYNITNSINALANDISNIHAEILTVLSGQSISPNNSSTQLNAALLSYMNATIVTSNNSQHRVMLTTTAPGTPANGDIWLGA